MQILSGKIKVGIEGVISTFLPLSNQTEKEFEMSLTKISRRSPGTLVCTFPNCTKKHKAHGFCDEHYRRLRVYGDASVVRLHQSKATGDTYEARFWSRVDKTSGLGRDGDCWEWVGGSSSNGYGMVVVGVNRSLSSHHAVWFFTHGTDSPHYLLHSCDNRKCVNIAHLFEGTLQDNHADMVRKGRCPHGEKHWKAKLSATDVLNIRARRADGDSVAQLMAEYGIRDSTVRRISSGKSWARLTADSLPATELANTDSQ